MCIYVVAVRVSARECALFDGVAGRRRSPSVCEADAARSQLPPSPHARYEHASTTCKFSYDCLLLHVVFCGGFCVFMLLVSTPVGYFLITYSKF